MRLKPSNIGSGVCCLFMDQETKRMDVCPMKKISRIRLLFPVFVFLLWAPRPSYCAIAHDGTSATTCAQTSGTAASQMRSLDTSTTAGGVCWFRKKLHAGAVTPSMVWLAVFHATLTTTTASPGPDSMSSAIAFEAATATVFSNFINRMEAGCR
jgi:hypothetical protein